MISYLITGLPPHLHSFIVCISLSSFLSIIPYKSFRVNNGCAALLFPGPSGIPLSPVDHPIVPWASHLHPTCIPDAGKPRRCGAYARETVIPHFHLWPSGLGGGVLAPASACMCWPSWPQEHLALISLPEGTTASILRCSTVMYYLLPTSVQVSLLVLLCASWPCSCLEWSRVQPACVRALVL